MMKMKMKSMMKSMMMKSTNFSDIVNDDVRDLASVEDSNWLRNEKVLEWKFELRSIVGSLASTRANKLREVVNARIAFLYGGNEKDLLEVRAKFLDWVAKTSWFEARVMNSLEESCVLVRERFGDTMSVGLDDVAALRAEINAINEEMDTW